MGSSNEGVKMKRLKSTRVTTPLHHERRSSLVAWTTESAAAFLEKLLSSLLCFCLRLVRADGGGACGGCWVISRTQAIKPATTSVTSADVKELTATEEYAALLALVPDETGAEFAAYEKLANSLRETLKVLRSSSNVEPTGLA